MTITEPTANFTYSPDAVDPLKIAFTNTSTNAVSYRWDFGDSTSADLTANPTHTYAAAGTYTVVLTAQDIAGVSDTETKNITVIAAPVTYTVTLPEGEGYTAAFVAGSSSPAVAGSDVSFTVVATEGYGITKVKNGSQTLTDVNGVYTINAIAADTVITVVVTLIGG
jgi:PKD repeat protein